MKISRLVASASVLVVMVGCSKSTLISPTGVVNSIAPVSVAPGALPPGTTVYLVGRGYFPPAGLEVVVGPTGEPGSWEAYPYTCSRPVVFTPLATAVQVTSTGEGAGPAWYGVNRPLSPGTRLVATEIRDYCDGYGVTVMTVK